jgi:hypothetical protein
MSASATYSATEKVVLCLTGGALIPFFSFLVYRYARRHMTERETLGTRLFYIYQAMYGAIIGICIGHLFTFWGTRLLSVGMVIGFVINDLIDRIDRYYWNKNIHGVYESIGSSTFSHHDSSLDRTRVIKKDFESFDNLGSEETAERMSDSVDESKLNQRKLLYFFIQYFASLFVVMNNGLVLIVGLQNGTPSALMTVCFYLNSLTLSLVFFGSMSHAEFFVDEKDRRRRIFYAAISLTWCLALFLSCVPVLADVPFSTAYLMLSHPAYIIVYKIIK